MFLAGAWSGALAQLTARKLAANIETEFMNRVDQYPEVSGIDALMDAVAEIEYMSGMISKPVDDLGDPGADALGVRI